VKLQTLQISQDSISDHRKVSLNQAKQSTLPVASAMIFIQTIMPMSIGTLFKKNALTVKMDLVHVKNAPMKVLAQSVKTDIN
jgi:hypothetical protein